MLTCFRVFATINIITQGISTIDDLNMARKGSETLEPKGYQIYGEQYSKQQGIVSKYTIPILNKTRS